MRFVLLLAIAVLPAFPANADVKVDHEADADFESYHTYAWRPGTEAARPEAQKLVVEAVERELEARGMRKVSDGKADFYVVTHAFAEMGSQVRANYVHMDVYDVGVITADVVDTSKGVLMIDLIDGESERPVWRAVASEVMGDPSAKKVRKTIDKVTRKMFKDFPPR
jgi:hypothetical protein